jgi:xanthine dehydrogenase YagS FAD-binding subunit
MNSFQWADPTTIAQAIELTINGSSFKAGGIDLLDLMKDRIAAPTRLINLKSIPGLDQIKQDEAGITIGPLVTLAQLAADPIVAAKCPALAQAAAHSATPQVRNMATLGGNLLQRPRCWYFRNALIHCSKKGGEISYAQDGEDQDHAIFNNQLCAIVHPSSAAVPLVAHGATIELTSSQATRKLSLEEFFTLPSVDLHRENSIAPDEVLTAVRIPSSPAGSRSIYLKQGEKESFDWPIAEVAVVIEQDGGKCKKASLILGAAAPVPHRAKEAEDALVGQPINKDTAAAAASAALASATPLAQNAYKIQVFKTLIARAILAAAGESQ